MPDPTTDTATLTAYREGKRPWHEIEPKDAVDLSFPHPEIWGPVNEEGVECPWPWDPIQLAGRPIGQYHCGYCGAMILGGQPHLDYIGIDEARDEYAKDFE